jgi:hypothetical protein
LKDIVDEVYSFSKYLPTAYYTPSTVGGRREKTRNNTEKAPLSWSLL